MLSFAHRHERRSERVAVDFSAYFDKSLTPEVVHRIRPNYICPSTMVRTLFQLGGEGPVQHEAHDIGRNHQTGEQTSVNTLLRESCGPSNPPCPGFRAVTLYFPTTRVLRHCHMPTILPQSCQ